MIFNWRIKEITIGTVFHDLTVIKLLNGKSKDGSLIYLCKCICGKFTEVQRSKLSNNRTKSCGCGIIRSKQKEAGEVSFKVLYGSYRARAKKDNLDFELTYEQFKSIVIQDCVYDGTKPPNYNTYIIDGNKSRSIRQESIDRAWIKANGIDRVDPNQGYILDNCVPCCSQCNYAKSDYTKEEFIQHNERMYLYQQTKKDANN